MSYIRHISIFFSFVFNQLRMRFRDAKRFTSKWNGRLRLCTFIFRIMKYPSGYEMSALPGRRRAPAKPVDRECHRAEGPGPVRSWINRVEREDDMNRGVGYALLAALLFGASTPFAKILLGQSAPLVVAGLFYLGSGMGLGAWMLIRRAASGEASAPDRPTALARADWPWLAGATLCGGIIAPILLMSGLRSSAASDASLLLNLEAVFTACFAWFLFHEQAGRRIMLGMLLIVVAGVLLSWSPGAGADAPGMSIDSLLIAGACVGWAIDNNLTRKVSAADPVQVAAVKGLAAGAINLGLAISLSMPLPPWQNAATAAAIGFASYGVSLVLFVLALRHLGTARTAAYFSAAPFAGVVLSLLILHEVPAPLFWVALALMAAGLWLHLTEHHSHRHRHRLLRHAHSHEHDAHHRHTHDFAWDGGEPHAHSHVHEALEHEHAHVPDIHHRHRHRFLP
jgi:drug/metabolite transporter (DMT)-like permease